MWYVVQTKSGDEQKIVNGLNNQGEDGAYDRCFVPLMEEVSRRGNKSCIRFKRLFAEYLFVETEDPAKIKQMLRKIPGFTRVLGAKEDDGEITFIPITPEDQEFLESLMDDGVMHVSYIKLTKSNKIEKIVGPLARYRNHIVKLETRHRMAVVETDIFGKHRRIKFGLWTDGDPSLPWLDDQMEKDESELIDQKVEIDIGVHPGDHVIDETGVYGDMEFVVDRVDPVHRRVYTTIHLGSAAARVELRADSVRVV